MTAHILPDDCGRCFLFLELRTREYGIEDIQAALSEVVRKRDEINKDIARRKYDRAKADILRGLPDLFNEFRPDTSRIRLMGDGGQEWEIIKGWDYD